MSRIFYFFSYFIFFTSIALAQNNVSVLNFDGDDSFFINDNSNQLDIPGSDWTLEAWVYPTVVPAIGTYPKIMSRKYSFEIAFRNESNNLGFGISALDGGGSGFTLEATATSGSNTMSLNIWHHIAVSSEYVAGTSTRTTRLFIDGTQVGSSTDPDFSLDASVSAINFGVRYEGSYTGYVDDCAMDEIRYSDIARYTSSFSITTWSAPHTTDANTLILYHLDENTGTAITNDGSADFNANLRAAPNDAEWKVWSFFMDSLPLPVKYIEPLVASMQNNAVNLTWATATEINNSGFAIEQSIDNANWQEIGFVDGAGNSNIIRKYSFIDKYPSKENYYRLRQIDFDAKSSFSNVVYIGANNNSEISVYPNPTSGVIHIRSDAKIKRIELRNSMGEIVNNYSPIHNTLDVSKCNSGIYFLSIFMEDNTIVNKMITKI